MPAAFAYTPNDEDLRNDAIAERSERAAKLDRATKYYEGQHKKPLITKPRAPDLNVTVNLFGMRVDRRIDFLFRGFPDIELGPEDETTETEPSEEEWLEQGWKFNGGITFANEMALVGCLMGHVYMKVLPPEDGEEIPKLRLITNAITFWDADDYKKCLWHELQWKIGQTYYRQDILNLKALGDEKLGTDGWKIYEYSSPNGEQWTRTDEIEWPYDVPPMIDWQHWPKYGSYYGRGEADDLDLNDSVNRMLSQANSIIRNHAFPKTIATGVSAAKVQETSVDSFWAIENENAKVFNLEMQSDLSTITNLAQSLIDLYMVQGRIMMLKGGPADFARVTNLGIRTAFMDMLNANTTLQQQYGEGMRQISMAMLGIANKRNDWPDFCLGWVDPLPENLLENAQLAQLTLGMGLSSKQTAADTVGLDYAVEAKRIDAESEADGAVMDRLINTGGSQPFQLTPPPMPPDTSKEDRPDATSK